MEKFKYWKLGITIFIAVTLSQLTTDFIKLSTGLFIASTTIKAYSQKIEAEKKMAAQRLEAEARNRPARDAEIARQQQKYQAEQKRLQNPQNSNQSLK